MNPLTCQRAAFDLPEEICWLNSAYMSPLLHSVKQAAHQGVDVRGQPWTLTSNDFFEPAQQVRELFAELIHGDAAGVALVPSVSYGIGIAAKNIPVSSGQNIVVVKEQFPSNIYPWKRLAEENDLSIRTVEFGEANWTNSILDQIDEETAIISIPHVHWTTGVQFDLKAISSKAKEFQAALVIDATQSLGTLPINVQDIQPDFLITAAYKCLLGPYTLSYLYVAPKWRNGVPLEEGWINRANAADFSQLTEYCDQYVSGAARYDYGERANTILLPMAIASLNQLLDWKVERIAQYTKPLIEQIVSKADAMNLWHPPIEECSPCMVGIGLPGESPNDLGAQLAERNVYVSVRKSNARIAPHIYNDANDVDHFFEVLAELVST